MASGVTLIPVPHWHFFCHLHGCLSQNRYKEGHFLGALNLNWYKSYDKKQKKTKNAKDENVCVLVQNNKKEEMEILSDA